MNIIKDDLIIRRDEILTFTHSVSETFLALYEIALQDKELLEGRPMALIVEQLFTIESKPGGPYYSTFTNGSIQPKIFDSETNTAIARFLGLYDIELPALTEFLEGKTFLVPEDSVKKSTLSRQEKELFVAMRTNIKNRLKAFPRDMQKRALAVIQRTIAGNPDKQMSLMAYYMTLALGNGMNTQTKKYVTEMGVVNSFFWTAFIIYDDFWDEDEAQDTRLLPIANFFARSYSEYFTSLLPERVGFKTFFHKVMDALDSANVWETTYCRAVVQENIFIIPSKLPVYGDYLYKYQAASGHIFGPVALLCMQGHKIHSAEVQKLITYFEHYLIAMQLSDDMHDWEEDLARGHISTAVVQLLKDYNKKNKKKEVHLENDIDELRQIFWFTTIPTLAKKALTHTQQSRDALYSMKSIKDVAPLEQFILIPENSIREVLRNHQQSVQFLKNFI